MESLTLADGRTACWDRHTGRGFIEPTDPRASALRAQQLRFGEPLAQWIPQRSRHVLLLPLQQALWGPLPLIRTASGHAYALNPIDLELWAEINGSRTVGGIAERLNQSVQQILEQLAPLMAPERQAVQIWPARVPPARLRHLIRPARPDHARTDDQFADGTTSLGAYHQGLEHAALQFDERETTVAHVLALPHPGLSGVPYGTALRSALAARGFETSTAVVEVGCGTGELARDWGAHIAYIRVDRSPGLLGEQHHMAPPSVGVLGDATALPLATGSVRCLISNEVLADLPSASTETGWDNVGSRGFVWEIARVLAPGGRAFLSEFGVLEGEVEEARQLDHPEVSIQFTDLASFARSLGLSAEILPLAELLELDLNAEQLARHSWRALRALLRTEGHPIGTRAWTRQSLTLPWPVQGLEWTSLADEGPGPLITRFYALLLRR